MNTNFTDNDIKLMLQIIYVLEAPIPLFDSLKQNLADVTDTPLSDINELFAKVKLFFDNQLEN